MRTPLLAMAILLALATLPLAAADREVDLEVAFGTSGAQARSAAADAPVQVPTSTEASTEDATAALPVAAPDVIELTSVKADTSAEAGGVGFYARAGAVAKKAEEAARDLAPALEKAAPPVVATAGVLALFQAMGIWRFLGLGAVGLYSRLAKSDLLDNAHRDRVYKLIQEAPGKGVSEIAKETGLGWGTTVYHLDRLERAGFVAAERGGLHKCYYPVGTLAKEDRKGMGALKADMTRSIAAFLVQRPGATQSELCAALGLSPSAASKQVTKLEEAGLVRREREWKTVRLLPAASLPALLGTETVPVATGPVPGPMPGLVLAA